MPHHRWRAVTRVWAFVSPVPAIRMAVRPMPFPRQPQAGCGRCVTSLLTMLSLFGKQQCKWTRRAVTFHHLLPRKQAASGRFRLHRHDHLRCRLRVRVMGTTRRALSQPAAALLSLRLSGILECPKSCCISLLVQEVVPTASVLSLEFFSASTRWR